MWCDFLCCVMSCNATRCHVMWWAVICCALQWDGMLWACDVIGCEVTLCGSKWLCDDVDRCGGPKYYSVLQSTTPCYSLLQSTTQYYNVVQSTTLYYKVLLRTAEYYNVLPRTTKYYSVLLTHLGGLLTLPLMWATSCGTLTMFGFLGAQRAGPKSSIWSLTWLVKPISTAFCQAWWRLKTTTHGELWSLGLLEVGGRAESLASSSKPTVPWATSSRQLPIVRQNCQSPWRH